MRSMLALGAMAVVLSSCSYDTPAAETAAAKPTLLDCALRDAPLSLDSPLYDVLLSDAGRAVLEKHMPGAIAKMPPFFTSRQTPSFATILAMKQAAGMAGLSSEKMAALEADLRALPVSEADKIARCERYNANGPTLSLPTDKPNVLLFEKVNGFYHTDAIPAARAAVQSMGEAKGWSVYTTDNAGVFTPENLAQFDVVVWSNNSGDVLTLSQRAAFETYMKQGGAAIALHGAAGDPSYFWEWYPDDFIGARFKGHPMNPQFQDARVITHKDHPLSAALPAEWVMNDEWYAFHKNPRERGVNVLLSLDESSYVHGGMNGEDLSMGGEHPIAWTKCVGKGRSFYSAIGHLPESYTHPVNKLVMDLAFDWAMNAKDACPG